MWNERRFYALFVCCPFIYNKVRARRPFPQYKQMKMHKKPQSCLVLISRFLHQDHHNVVASALSHPVRASPRAPLATVMSERMRRKKHRSVPSVSTRYNIIMFARGTARTKVTGDWFPVNEGGWALSHLSRLRNW